MTCLPKQTTTNNCTVHLCSMVSTIIVVLKQEIISDGLLRVLRFSSRVITILWTLLNEYQAFFHECNSSVKHHNKS